MTTMTGTTRLLLHEASLARVRDALAAHGRALTLLVMDRHGQITVEGQAADTDPSGPDAAWASNDVFESPAARAFMVAMLKAPKLAWVQSAAAGFDHPIFRQLVEKGVRLTPTHTYGVGISEYVVAGVLDHFQRGPERRAARAAKAWRRFSLREVMGTRWLIVGFGGIGQAVAERARAFGAVITGVRRDLAPHPLAETIAPIDQLPVLLLRADVVVLATPLTAATHRLADAAFFAAMKPGSVLVNIGRGGLVDETALLAALDRGVPEHAVLDVFETEPLPAESPFWIHPRVSLTAHTSGITSGQRARNDAAFLENLSLFLAGEPPPGAVDARDVLAS